MSIEKNPFARIMPLPLKNLFIRIADEVVESRTTACISNLGKIQMPPEFERYIDSSVSYPMSEDLRLRYVHTGTKWR